MELFSHGVDGLGAADRAYDHHIKREERVGRLERLRGRRDLNICACDVRRQPRAQPGRRGVDGRGERGQSSVVAARLPQLVDHSGRTHHARSLCAHLAKPGQKVFGIGSVVPDVAEHFARLVVPAEQLAVHELPPLFVLLHALLDRPQRRLQDCFADDRLLGALVEPPQREPVQPVRLEPIDDRPHVAAPDVIRSATEKIHRQEETEHADDMIFLLREDLALDYDSQAKKYQEESLQRMARPARAFGRVGSHVA